MDVSYVYFLGVFGSRLVLILSVCPKSPSLKQFVWMCWACLQMFPVVTDWWLA
jgi:hypothetical protein